MLNKFPGSPMQSTEASSSPTALSREAVGPGLMRDALLSHPFRLQPSRVGIVTCFKDELELQAEKVCPGTHGQARLGHAPKLSKLLYCHATQVAQTLAGL
jgi:hypothetical protein